LRGCVSRHLAVAAGARAARVPERSALNLLTSASRPLRECAPFAPLRHDARAATIPYPECGPSIAGAIAAVALALVLHSSALAIGVADLEPRLRASRPRQRSRRFGGGCGICTQTPLAGLSSYRQRDRLSVKEPVRLDGNGARLNRRSNMDWNRVAAEPRARKPVQSDLKRPGWSRSPKASWERCR
jgi:hypothetical protein